MAHIPRYTAEFKAEAVRLATSGERSIPKTAADLGIATDSLRAWIKQAKIDAGGQRLLRLTPSSSLPACPAGRDADDPDHPHPR